MAFIKKKIRSQKRSFEGKSRKNWDRDQELKLENSGIGTGITFWNRD